MNHLIRIALFALILPFLASADTLYVEKTESGKPIHNQRGETISDPYWVPSKAQFNNLIAKVTTVVSFERARNKTMRDMRQEDWLIFSLNGWRDNRKLNLKTMAGGEESNAELYKKFDQLVNLAEIGDLRGIQIIINELCPNHPSHRNPKLAVPIWNEEKTAEFYQQKEEEEMARLPNDSASTLKVAGDPY